jgi:hypothetical protein
MNARKLFTLGLALFDFLLVAHVIVLLAGL